MRPHSTDAVLRWRAALFNACELLGETHELLDLYWVVQWESSNFLFPKWMFFCDDWGVRTSYFAIDLALLRLAARGWELSYAY